MSVETIQIELKSEQLAALDAAVSRSHLDRNTIIETALENYLAYDTYYRDGVEAGLRDTENGNTVPHEEVVAKLENFMRDMRSRF